MTPTSLPAEPGHEELRDSTVGDLLRRAAADAPRHTAVVFATVEQGIVARWTYEELFAEACAAAHALRARFEPGERVAIWASNRPE